MEANLDIGYEPNQNPQPTKIITKLVPARQSKSGVEEKETEKVRKGIQNNSSF